MQWVIVAGLLLAVAVYAALVVLGHQYIERDTERWWRGRR